MAQIYFSELLSAYPDLLALVYGDDKLGMTMKDCIKKEEYVMAVPGHKKGLQE